MTSKEALDTAIEYAEKAVKREEYSSSMRDTDIRICLDISHIFLNISRELDVRECRIIDIERQNQQNKKYLKDAYLST